MERIVEQGRVSEKNVQKLYAEEIKCYRAASTVAPSQPRRQNMHCVRWSFLVGIPRASRKEKCNE